jgi:hypothetical protein
MAAVSRIDNQRDEARMIIQPALRIVLIIMGLNDYILP